MVDLLKFTSNKNILSGIIVIGYKSIWKSHTHTHIYLVELSISLSPHYVVIDDAHVNIALLHQKYEKEYLIKESPKKKKFWEFISRWEKPLSYIYIYIYI